MFLGHTLCKRKGDSKMENIKKRTTIYLNTSIHKILKLKSAETDRSISDIVEEAVCDELSLDREDLQTFEQRKKESTISYETLLNELKENGKI
jgi:hypothetical protein